MDNMREDEDLIFFRTPAFGLYTSDLGDGYVWLPRTQRKIDNEILDMDPGDVMYAYSIAQAYSTLVDREEPLMGLSRYLVSATRTGIFEFDRPCVLSSIFQFLPTLYVLHSQEDEADELAKELRALEARDRAGSKGVYFSLLSDDDNKALSRCSATSASLLEHTMNTMPQDAIPFLDYGAVCGIVYKDIVVKAGVTSLPYKDGVVKFIAQADKEEAAAARRKLSSTKARLHNKDLKRRDRRHASSQSDVFMLKQVHSYLYVQTKLYTNEFTTVKGEKRKYRDVMSFSDDTPTTIPCLLNRISALIKAAYALEPARKTMGSYASPFDSAGLKSFTAESDKCHIDAHVAYFSRIVQLTQSSRLKSRARKEEDIANGLKDLELEKRRVLRRSGDKMAEFMLDNGYTGDSLYYPGAQKALKRRMDKIKKRKETEGGGSNNVPAAVA